MINNYHELLWITKNQLEFIGIHKILLGFYDFLGLPRTPYDFLGLPSASCRTSMITTRLALLLGSFVGLLALQLGLLALPLGLLALLLGLLGLVLGLVDVWCCQNRAWCCLSNYIFYSAPKLQASSLARSPAVASSAEIPWPLEGTAGWGCCLRSRPYFRLLIYRIM